MCKTLSLAVVNYRRRAKLRYSEAIAAAFLALLFLLPCPADGWLATQSTWHKSFCLGDRSRGNVTRPEWRLLYLDRDLGHGLVLRSQVGRERVCGGLIRKWIVLKADF